MEIALWVFGLVIVVAWLIYEQDKPRRFLKAIMDEAKWSESEDLRKLHDECVNLMQDGPSGAYMAMEEICHIGVGRYGNWRNEKPRALMIKSLHNAAKRAKSDYHNLKRLEANRVELREWFDTKFRISEDFSGIYSINEFHDGLIAWYWDRWDWGRCEIGLMTESDMIDLVQNEYQIKRDKDILNDFFDKQMEEDHEYQLREIHSWFKNRPGEDISENRDRF